MAKQHALAGIIGQRETAVIGAVVDEIVASPQEQLGLKLMPVREYPQTLIYHEKVTGFGGLIAERQLGAQGPVSAVSSSQTFEFSGGFYQESKRFTERDLISLKRLGGIGDRGVTGLTSGAMDFMTRAGVSLKQKLTNRLNQLAWQALLHQTYTFNGVVKYNFGTPSSNIVTAATDWSIQSTSTPFTDLMTILKQNPSFYKYKIKELIINPKTESYLLESQEAKTLIINNAQAYGDVNKIRSILYPGLPPFKVCQDSYQDESVTLGQVVHSAAQYFVDDFYVLAVVDFSGSGAELYTEYGEIQLGYNMNNPSATVENPAMGIYAFVDEQGLLDRKSPWVDVVTGFNGGPNLMRSNDPLIIKGKSGI